MLRTQHRSCGFTPAVVLGCIGCLSAPLAALPAPQGQLARDGVTLVAAPSTSAPTVASGMTDVLTCADLVYFEENGGPTGGRGLYNFCSATGVSSPRVAVGGAQRLFSLAVAPSGAVFGIDPLTNTIYLVDLSAGTLTFVVALVGVATVADITFDPVSGQLYGSERNSPMRLYRIDLVSGATTTMGTMTSVRSGLTFAPNGNLYGCTLNGTLYHVDPTTAAETLVGGGGGPGLLEDAAVRADGMIFVTDFDGDLFSIDPATGTNTLLGNSGLGTGLLGIVPAPGAAAAVETARPGVPPNPMALMPGLTSGPIAGATWDPVIDHSSFFPGALIDVLGLSLVTMNTPSPFGTLLCSPSVLFAGPVGVPFSLSIPANCSLAGFAFTAQGAATDGISILLTNALDVVVGTF